MGGAASGWLLGRAPNACRRDDNRTQAEVQADSTQGIWRPPTGPLGRLTDAAHQRAMSVRSRRDEFIARASGQPPARPFAAVLRGDSVRVIAEVKRASPSKGVIAPTLDAAAQAEAYVQGGAAAISVLTEPTAFAGSIDDLAAVSARVAVPVIRKDFLVDPVQLWEARAAGASAALLIVRALPEALLRVLLAEAAAAGLEALVEVRDEPELERALAAGARVIGVNNRNLETLEIDPRTAPGLIPHIPTTCIAVAESGMQTVADLQAAAAAGADAVLVGSAISAAADPAAAVDALARVPRRAR